VVTEDDHGICDVLANTRKRFDLAARPGKATPPLRHLLGETSKGGGASTPQTDRLEEGLELVVRRSGKSPPTRESSNKPGEEAGDRLGAGALQEKF
jgi:hypothetical protein